MRTPLVTALLVLTLVLALVGCGNGNDGTDEQVADPTATSRPPSTPGDSTRAPASSPTGAPTTAPTTPSAGTTACDEVVAGIDAFNVGDFYGTIQHFEQAVPLAEDEAEADPSDAADDLLAAVRYYADLPADEYLTASATSPEFAKYQAITLGQCSDGPVGPAPPSSSAVTV